MFSSAGDVHLQRPLQLNRDSIRFVKLTIEHLENKKIENDRGQMVDLLTTGWFCLNFRFRGAKNHFLDQKPSFRVEKPVFRSKT